MSDVIDQAQLDSEIHLNAAIAKAKQPTQPEIKVIGLCHNCYEGLEGNKLFCDSDCSDDYHKRVNRR